MTDEHKFHDVFAVEDSDRVNIATYTIHDGTVAFNVTHTEGHGVVISIHLPDKPGKIEVAEALSRAAEVLLAQ